MADLVRKLGERIRNVRKERGLSQEQLGELAGLHTNYIGQIERGEKNLTIESLGKVTAGLGISMEELFRYLSPMKSKDDLQELVDLLSQRSARDHAMALNLVKTVLKWEQEK